MWTLLAIGIGAWVLIAVVAALILGRAVRVAEQRRPRAARTPGSARRRAAVALERVVTLATGSIPVIGPRIATAMTGATPVSGPRLD